MKRYSILVIEYGSKREVELCQVERDPHALARAAAERTLRINTGKRMVNVPKYDSVRVVDHRPDTTPAAEEPPGAADVGPPD